MNLKKLQFNYVCSYLIKYNILEFNNIKFGINVKYDSRYGNAVWNIILYEHNLDETYFLTKTYMHIQIKLLLKKYFHDKLKLIKIIEKNHYYEVSCFLGFENIYLLDILKAFPIVFTLPMYEYNEINSFSFFNIRCNSYYMRNFYEKYQDDIFHIFENKNSVNLLSDDNKICTYDIFFKNILK